ncbi:hypothetical protein [Ruminococcus sp.]|uniref:hypothetical protein n=1 Tax=Ruminococcus sp. TaxID=41978 RepID=UPI0025CD93AB|nr:hypothetical protein [Ruminococcus sp.]MBQ8967920.1 hypothetical protein [Ruminococcus sp.]
MTEYLTSYRRYILACLEDESCDFEKLLDYHEEKLHQFQHERFIHLIVMALFALCTVMTVLAVVIYEKLTLIPLAVLLLCLLVPYIKHYFFLENTVQKLYKDYDAIYKKVHGFSQEDLK